MVRGSECQGVGQQRALSSSWHGGGGAHLEWNIALQVSPLGGQFCSEKMEFGTSPDLTVHVCPLPDNSWAIRSTLQGKGQ